MRAELSPELTTTAATRAAELEHYLELVVPELEAGLGEVGFPFRPTRPDHRLRIRGACGIASETIARYLRSAGERATSVIRRFDSFEHVMNRVDGYDEPIVIDASYSQFFADYGMTTWQERDVPGLAYYPEQRVIAFPESRLPEVAEWASDITWTFWRRCQGQPDGPNPWNHSFQFGVSRAELTERFSELWDVSKYAEWEHDVDYLIRDAAALATRLRERQHVS